MVGPSTARGSPGPSMSAISTAIPWASSSSSQARASAGSIACCCSPVGANRIRLLARGATGRLIDPTGPGLSAPQQELLFRDKGIALIGCLEYESYASNETSDD